MCLSLAEAPGRRRDRLLDRQWSSDREQLASLTISQSGTRMHPCDGCPGIKDGSFVPWIPMTPPPGQSVSTLESAEVPNASGP